MATGPVYKPAPPRLPIPALRRSILCLCVAPAEQAEHALLLSKGGWAASIVNTVEAALGRLTSGSYDAVLVGSSVPIADQYAICRLAREEFGVPVVVLRREFIEPNLRCDAQLAMSDRHRIFSVLRRVMATPGEGRAA